MKNVAMLTNINNRKADGFGEGGRKARALEWGGDIAHQNLFSVEFLLHQPIFLLHDISRQWILSDPWTSLSPKRLQDLIFEKYPHPSAHPTTGPLRCDVSRDCHWFYDERRTTFKFGRVIEKDFEK